VTVRASQPRASAQDRRGWRLAHSGITVDDCSQHRSARVALWANSVDVHDAAADLYEHLPEAAMANEGLRIPGRRRCRNRQALVIAASGVSR